MPKTNLRVTSFAILTLILVVLNRTAYGYENLAPVNVSVGGQHIALDDFRNLTRGMLTAHIRQVTKDPASMPKDAPLIYFAGNNVIWVSREVHQDLGAFANVSAKDQAGEDAFVAAAALAAMDAGSAGHPWEDIYRRTPTDRAARLALGYEVAAALKEASAQSESYASRQGDWIKSNIVPGMSRNVVYGMLKTRGLVAYNPEFQYLDPTNGCLPSQSADSGTWPTASQATPAPKAACASHAANLRPPTNPYVIVLVEGAFGLGCDSPVQATIRFDRNDRVSEAEVVTLSPACV